MTSLAEGFSMHATQLQVAAHFPPTEKIWVTVLNLVALQN